jgi:hypothetical protein
MAVASSGKIPGAVEIIHLTESMVAFPRWAQFDCASIFILGLHGKLDPYQAALDPRACLIGPYRNWDSLRQDMTSLNIAAGSPIRCDEAVQIAYRVYQGGPNCRRQRGRRALGISCNDP